MVHLFNHKVCPQVKSVVPSPTDFPTLVELQNELQHCSHFKSQVMMRNKARRNIPDGISSTSQHENVRSKQIKNTSIPSISSPSQGKNKSYQCHFTECEKRFQTVKDLKRHWVVHTRLKKFQCSYCHVSFGRNDHKIRHEKSTHLKSCEKSVIKTLKEQLEERKRNILLPSFPRHLQQNNPQPHIALSIPSTSKPKHFNAVMEDGNRTPDNHNVASPSSTASGSTSSVRDMAKLLAMSVFSRAKKRKHNQIKDGIDDASTNSDDSLSAPIPLPKSGASFLNSGISANKIAKVTNSAPISVINAKTVNIPNDSAKRNESSGDGSSLDARNSPILKNLLFPSTSSTVPQATHPSKIPETMILKNLLYGQANEDSKSSSPSQPIAVQAKKTETISLRFLCCFSTLVLKPPAPREINKSTKSDEHYVSYVCYAFDKGTLMCNNGAPTDSIRNILTFSKKTGGKIPCTFIYDDSSLKRRSYSRFLIPMASQGWSVNVPKPGTARDVLQYIRSHEAFFLPDQGLSKVMSYVRQNYNGLLIKETIPMIEGDKIGNLEVSSLRPYDLQKIGEGKDCYLLRSCSVKRQQRQYGTSNMTAQNTTLLPPNILSRPSQKPILPKPPPPYPSLSVTSIPTQSSAIPSENIQITVLSDPNGRGKSETLVLPSMGNATITLHSASSEVIDTCFNSSSAKQTGSGSLNETTASVYSSVPISTEESKNYENASTLSNSFVTPGETFLRTTSTSNSSSGDIKPEEIPIVDAQYPLLNHEQQKKVTSCSTCGVSFSLIAEKLLHYTENLTCMKVITEKYKFFQPENNFYSIVAADIEQTARCNPETMPSSYPCSACEAVTKKSIFGYCWHRDRHRPFTVRLFICSICTAMFRTPYNYVNHSCFSQNTNTKQSLREEPFTINETSHKSSRSNSTPDNSEFAMYCQLSEPLRNFFLRCPIHSCGKTFIYISGLLGHLRTHQACLTALIGDVSPSDLETGKITLNKLLIRYNKSTKGIIVPSSTGPYPCETCTDVSMSPLAYMLHRDHHKLKDNESRLLCKVCEELFVTPCAFYNHNCASKTNTKSSVKEQNHVTWCIFCARLENLPKMPPQASNAASEQQSQKQSQINDDSDKSDIQIVNVCSLSSVLNMYLPENVENGSEKQPRGNVISNALTHSNPITSHTHVQNTDNSKACKNIMRNNIKERSLGKSLPSTAATSLDLENTSLSVHKASNNSDSNSKEIPKNSESLVLKITNLKSSRPLVSPVKTNSKSNASTLGPPPKGRIKVKSVKELMAIAPDELSVNMSENVASSSESQNASMGQKSHQDCTKHISELRVGAPFSLTDKNDMSNEETGNANFEMNKKINTKANDNSKQNLIKIPAQKEENGETGTNDINRATNFQSNNVHLVVPSIHLATLIDESPNCISKSMEEKLEPDVEPFDKDDCYICMDCQPLKLLNGLGLTSHCIKNPSHLQINHLADFNKFNIILDKLHGNTLVQYTEKAMKSIEQHRRHGLTRQSSVSSTSSSSENVTGSPFTRRKRSRTIRLLEATAENVGNHFESSDTGTDAEDIPLDAIYSKNRKKNLIPNKNHH